MRRTAPRDNGANLKLLGGTLRLLEFTARQLANFAGVNLETARSFVEENCRNGLFEVVGKVANTRGGRPANRYRIHPEGHAEILRRVAQIRRALAPEAPPAFAPDIDSDAASRFTPIDLLESAVEALASGEIADPRERDALIADARVSLHGAEADLRAIMARQAEVEEVEDFATRLRAARTRFDTEVCRPARRPLPYAAPLPVGGNLEAACTRFLEDWTAPLDLELTTPVALEFATGDADRPTDVDLEDVMDTALAIPTGGVESVFATSVMLQHCKAAWPEDALQTAVAERIRRISPSPDPWILAKLAVAAASLDAVQAVEPLLCALVSPCLAEQRNLNPELWLMCIRALARMARPRRGGADAVGAAAACQFFVARGPAEPAELAILIPGALVVAHRDAGALIRRLADALFESGGMKPDFAGRVEEGALARNLALAAQDRQFAVLKEHIPELLAHKSGRGLLYCLSKPRHNALELTDKDFSKRFYVKVGARVADYLGLRAPAAEELPQFTDQTAGELASILTDHGWIPRHDRDRMFTAKRAA